MLSSIRAVEKWNRKLHFYLGLYFLFFLWLFSLTGLMLNHGQWLVSIGATARVESRFDRAPCIRELMELVRRRARPRDGRGEAAERPARPRLPICGVDSGRPHHRLQHEHESSALETQ